MSPSLVSSRLLPHTHTHKADTIKQATRRPDQDMGGMRSDLDVLYAPPGSKRALLTAWSSLKSSIVHTPLDPMAGSKRSKVKKLLSPTRAASPPREPAMDDDALMDDLLAQLDAKNDTAKQEASTILTEVSVQKAVEVADQPKKDSRTRHQARQVRTVPAGPPPHNLMTS